MPGEVVPMGMPADAGSDPPRRHQADGGVVGEQRAGVFRRPARAGGWRWGLGFKRLSRNPRARDERDILEAWFRERHRSIEYSLILGRVHRLLSRIQAGETCSIGSKRQVRRLLREIEAAEQDDPGRDA